MNKKGTSLIEMITAIMILSIASVLILSGFMGVLRFIGKANDIQQGSDAMLSYAEKSKDDSVYDQVDAEVKPTSYTIKNDRGKSVTINAKFNALSALNTDAITLKVLKNEIHVLVSETPEYKVLKANAISLYNISKEEANKIDPNYDWPYTTIMYNIFQRKELKWDTFDSMFLPKELKKFASDAKPFYIVGYYPWDYFFADRSVNHGGFLIYISQSYQFGSKNNPIGPNETIHMIYDYIDNRWYYYPGDDYEVAYEGYNEMAPSLLYKKSNTVIASFDELRTYIKASNSGWYVLDETVEFDASLPDASWIAIK